MTPSDRLRRMVADATPGPWHLTESEDVWGHQMASFRRILGTAKLADLDLVQLAPDLAAWAADARDALAAYEGFYDDDCGDPDCGDCVPGRNLRALLAGFPLGNNEEAT